MRHGDHVLAFFALSSGASFRWRFPVSVTLLDFALRTRCFFALDDSCVALWSAN